MDTHSIWAFLGGVLAFGFIGYIGGMVFGFVVMAAWVFSKEGVNALIYYGVIAAMLAAFICFGLYEAFSGDTDVMEQTCWISGTIGFTIAGIQYLIGHKKDDGKK